MMYDLAIIGAGIIGLSTALEVSKRFPKLSIVVLEKELLVAQHQTGRNSGVVHAGVYYEPRSLKAQFCKDGSIATKRFCNEHGLPFVQCGKLIVATKDADLPRMAALVERSTANGLKVERLDARELLRREPNIRGLGALFVPSTAIVDYGLIAATMARLLEEKGVEIRTNATVDSLCEDHATVTLTTENSTIRARNVIVCAGLMAGKLARLAGLDLDFHIVPFRGEYFRLAPDKDNIVNHLIYPVPDPALPFLGIHLTRMIGGYVTVGPNAVLAFAREGYRALDIDLKDVSEIIAYPGFRRMARANLSAGLSEMWSSFSKRRYLRLCRHYCPELNLSDLLPHRAGVRAQAVLPSGKMAHDFLIRETARTIHVCNAPSPAATTAIPIGRHLADRALVHFGWHPGEPREGSTSPVSLNAEG